MIFLDGSEGLDAGFVGVDQLRGRIENGLLAFEFGEPQLQDFLNPH